MNNPNYNLNFTKKWSPGISTFFYEKACHQNLGLSLGSEELCTLKDLMTT